MGNVFPQEIEVWYVLPALRKELALALKQKGLKQNEISKKLGITESAISQYFKRKRANEVSFNKKIKQEIKNAAEKIIKNNSLISEIDRLCRIVKKENVLCDIHRRYSKVPKRCAICK